MLDAYNYISNTRGMSLVDEQISPIAIKVGAFLPVTVVEGRDSRLIGYADDGRVILFDNDDPKSAEIKVGDTVKLSENPCFSAITSPLWINLRRIPLTAPRIAGTVATA